MTSPIEPQELHAVLAPVVEQCGLYLEEVKIQAAGKTSLVRITVDALDVAAPAITLDEVAVASREISDALDKVKALKDAYTLEVSSPGTNRPLKTTRHYERAIGRLIKVTRTEGSDFIDRLEAVDGETLSFESEGDVALETIRKAKVEVELKRAESVKEEELVSFESDEESDNTGVEE